jgi:soluble lytic murein transglycosylase-like protein
MAVQLGLSSPTGHGCGIRTGSDRRRGDRRSAPRSGLDRRRSDRRRATLRSLLFSLLTVALPTQLAHLNVAALRSQVPQTDKNMLPSARVSVSIDSFIPVPPGQAYDGLIREAARRHKVDARLIRSIMQTESSFNPAAVSRAGAVGLMQLMPDLVRELGVTDPFDPRENVMAGARHLRRLLDAHDGNVKLAIASYNAGETAVARYGGVPPYPETRDYVRRVTRLLSRYGNRA